MMILFYWVDSSERAEEREKKKSVWNWAGPAPFRSYFADSLSTRKERAISPTTAWQIVIFQFPPSIFPHDWEKERETGKKKKEKKKEFVSSIFFIWK